MLTYSQIAKTVGYDTFASRQYLIDIDTTAFVMWVVKWTLMNKHRWNSIEIPFLIEAFENFFCNFCVKTVLCGIRSLVPHLIGPPSHWSPTHWSPNSLVPQYIIGAHWAPISLVPHITGPPSHWSPYSFVTPSSANPNGPPSHWSPISLVPHLIGPLTHQSPISLVPQLAPMHHPFHWSPISLVPQSNPVYPVLIGPPSHWSPNATLITQFSLVPPSHWSPKATMITQFSLVPHLIGPPMQPWLYSSHWSPILLVPQHMYVTYVALE